MNSALFANTSNFLEHGYTVMIPAIRPTRKSFYSSHKIMNTRFHPRVFPVVLRWKTSVTPWNTSRRPARRGGPARRAVRQRILRFTLLTADIFEEHLSWVRIDFLDALADSEDVPIRVPYVHLADVPRHVGRWESNVQPSGHALTVDFVNVVNPHRHPHALVGHFISVRRERRNVRTPAVASLRALAKKDLAFA